MTDGPNGTGISRRKFLGSASSGMLGAGVLGGCASCPDLSALTLPPAARPAADAHVHLFNAADLPVARYIKHVVGPTLQVPSVLIALVSLMGSVVKRTAMTASAEMALRVPPWQQGGAGHVSAAAFADAVADHIEAIVATTDPELLRATAPLGLLADGGAGPDNPADENLAERFDRAGEGELGDPVDDETRMSTVVLAALLGEWSAGRSRRAGPFVGTRAAEADSTDAASELLRAIVPVDRAMLAAIVTEAADDMTTTGDGLVQGDVPALLQDRLGAARLTADGLRTVKMDIGAILKWAWRMRQTRCRHVSQFLDFADNAAPALQVRQCINLLVDYDEWLDERPLAGSGHADQVRFWTQMARVTRERLVIHTFAGYDPLKDTYGRLAVDGGTSAYLAELLQWFESGRQGQTGASGEPAIAGLKLYPVMGFGVSGENFLPWDLLAGRRIRKKWLRDHPPSAFGPELDRTIEAFFAKVAEHDVPLFTHARRSNGATFGSNQFGDLLRWLERAKQHWERHCKPLRLCLGHYTLGDTDMDHLRQIMDLNRAGEARIYIDIAYGLQHGNWQSDHGPAEEQAREYVASLRDFANAHEGAWDYILFGSDWIMLEQQAGARSFVADAWRLVERDPQIGPELAHKVFASNFDRFLAPTGLACHPEPPQA